VPFSAVREVSEDSLLVKSSQEFFLLDIHEQSKPTPILTNHNYSDLRSIQYLDTVHAFIAINPTAGIIAFNQQMSVPYVIIPNSNKEFISKFAVHSAADQIHLTTIVQSRNTDDDKPRLKYFVLRNVNRSLEVSGEITEQQLNVFSITYSTDGKLLAATTSGPALYTTSIGVDVASCTSRGNCQFPAIDIKDNSGVRLIEDQLRGTPESWSAPSFSADKRRIAFHCLTGICVMNIDGTKLERLVALSSAIISNILWYDDDKVLIYATQDLGQKNVESIHKYMLISKQDSILYKDDKLQATEIALIPKSAAQLLLALPMPSQLTAVAPSLTLIEICSPSPERYRLWRVSNPNPIFVKYTIEILDENTKALISSAQQEIGPSRDSVPSSIDIPILASKTSQEIRLIVNGTLQATINTVESVCQVS
jgi:hypothetical protein